MCFAICMFALLCSGKTTLAYLSDGDAVVNHFRVGGVNISLEEEFPDNHFTAGTTMSKKVRIKNDGPGSCYVRIFAVFSRSDLEPYIQVDWNEQDFVYHTSDGYWYYKQRLDAGETTPYLFTTVAISEDTPQTVLGDFEFLVYGEAYQTSRYSGFFKVWDLFWKQE